MSETLQKIIKAVAKFWYQGEFSLRGDILDIFEIDQLQPYRIDFSEMIDGPNLWPRKSYLLKMLKKFNWRQWGRLLQEEDFIRGQQ